MKLKPRVILALLLPLQWLLVQWLKRNPETVERFYSNGIYPFFGRILRALFGWLPFSLGDLLYVLIIVFIFRFFWKRGRLFITSTREFFTRALSFVSVVFFLFYFLWGLNYYRQPFHEVLKIGNSYTQEELIRTTEALIQKCNSLHSALSPNDTIKVDVPYSKSEIYQKTIGGYKLLQTKHPELSYTPPSLKSSLLSLPLTYMGYSGYLNPFTNEAQVNYMMPAFKLPTTSAHEVAHQLGYAAENEANFIGYLATISNEDPIIEYIGYTYGLRYCLGEVYRVDIEAFERLSNSLNKGIKKNYKEGTAFWDQYKNRAEPVFKKTYDTYLKANNQAKGIESYSYVVALLVNYYKSQKP